MEWAEVIGNPLFARAQGQGECGVDFMSLAGIWQDRDITQEAIRKEAW
ncbi:hypothetical protein [Candidatus Electrothrix sp.]